MKVYKKIAYLSLALIMSLMLSACGDLSADYPDAASFEAALNNGEDTIGKTVRFTAESVEVGTALGCSILASEHVCFYSVDNPGIQTGDTVTVQVTAANGIFGYWLVQYETLSNKSGSPTSSKPAASEETYGSGSAPAEDPDTTYSETPSSLSDSPEPAESPQSLELVDHGFCVSSTSGDTVYMDFCGMIHNPNETFIATFPKILITVKNDDGTILTTDSQTGSVVMPGDTITLCGMVSIPTAGITDDTKIYFDVEWSDMDTDSFIYSGARTTDFEITNVSEQGSGYKTLITGEITNNYFEDVDSANLSVILRKDGKIVYIDNTFVDNLKVGKPKAFQISGYHDWPEHDTIDISAMVW